MRSSSDVSAATLSPMSRRCATIRSASRPITRTISDVTNRTTSVSAIARRPRAIERPIATTSASPNSVADIGKKTRSGRKYMMIRTIVEKYLAASFTGWNLERPMRLR